ncbi:raffinose/stachyose/melibiose transport system substrate-binding protein [Caldicellulosiruptor bescii]|uniref:Extracellular solute-binding protein family 1 n=2 Tax=Caldicellulosiruptor bescii TaxID=31899 RepID=B9MPG3_CALBD|nr:extracellular solute-binding protein [Caldicellulosiruptor bescii]ACM59724.1 extracellular solute-binding protein family 1 [Caldicellulosiruptor bescii DSM 6725]PBC87133.1 raffinose/stachyose/melibiose transport system substrate-binding protein [Caldicellulosiruptor bescii]PBC90072.1 raffinose/stachyose/melibiose transport system substrate-binding protein [Caldicellulosiruptor bescii]PBD04497.1 raffinose/stachyose/melibiose transport system substrate-binding protein [Caldicellulosiruptor bes
MNDSFNKRRLLSISFLVPLVTTLVLIIVLILNTQKTIEESVTIENEELEVNTKIRFLSPWGGSDPYAETLSFVLQKFQEENPGVTIVNESLFGDDFLIKLQTDFASGNPPDVFGLFPGSVRDLLIKRKQIAELTNILKKDVKWYQSFYSNMWKYVTFNGKIYGVPLETIVECLFVNKDIFEKYNLKVPQTLDDLISVSKILKSKGIIPIAFNAQPEGTYIYQNIIVSIGTKYEVENPIKNGEFSLPYIKALDYLKVLYKAGAFPANYYSLTSKQRNDLFLTKKAAMIVQGSWFIPKCDPKTVDIYIFPQANEKGKKHLIYGLGAGTFYVSSQAWQDIEKRNSAIKLLKFLSSEKIARIFVERTGLISNVKIKNPPNVKNSLRSKVEGLIKEADVLVAPPDHFVDRMVWEEVITKNIPYYLQGTISSKLFWARAVKAWKENMEKLGE